MFERTVARRLNTPIWMPDGMGGGSDHNGDSSLDVAVVFSTFVMGEGLIFPWT